MQFQRKMMIDHYLGAPLAWGLNICAQIVGKFTKRDHSLTTAPRTILFLKFIGLGSIVRASFLIDSARKRYPDAKIAFACFPGCAPLVKMYPEIDQVWVVRENSIIFLAIDTLKLLYKMWRFKVDLVVDLEVHSKYSSIVAGLSLARDRAGYAGVTSRFRRGLYTHLVFWNPLRFVDHAYEQLGLALGLKRMQPEHVPTLPSSALSEAQRYLSKLGISATTVVIGINPNASELRPERRWPLENFANLIRSLPSDKQLTVLLLGSPSERGYVEQLRQLTKDSQIPIHNTAGDLSFAGFTALLKSLSVLVTNDSGPLHLARAFKVPTVSLWGPTHPVVFSPRGEKHISLYKPIYCSPCTHASDVPPCGGDNRCLKQLSWVRVARALYKLLDMHPPSNLPVEIESESADSNTNEIVLGYWQRESAPSSLPILPAKNA